MGQKRKRTASPMGQSAFAGECAGGARSKRLAGGPDYLDALPDDLVLSILSKLAASALAPSDLLSVHLTYVSLLLLLLIDPLRSPMRRETPRVSSDCKRSLSQSHLERCSI